MRNGKAAGPSGVLSEMVKATGKAGVGMITDLLNQIVIEGVIPAEWKLRTVINCYQGEKRFFGKRKPQGSEINSSDYEDRQNY